jgi:flavin reductase (DIM6/NTAB) family NADH-FMN oxidoreductase RutF
MACRSIPFSACIVPRPIGWVSTVDKLGRPNLAPFSFFNGVGYTPPTIMFCPNGRDVDGGLSHSLLNVEETGEYRCQYCNFRIAPFHEPYEPATRARR